ncbi:MAG: Asp-tRNA(Asn)/Glu-tRNA(Gln) amidotransferase subunit GatC [Candidatus Omnitrophota bacterium]
MTKKQSANKFIDFYRRSGILKAMANNENVEYTANLARIDVSEREKASLGEQLSKIIGYIDKLKKLNTDNIEPMRGLHTERDVRREDKAKISGVKEDILNNSPLREGDYFKIPKVIE